MCVTRELYSLLISSEGVGIVGSFFGVVLIARPQFLFGSVSGHQVPLPSDVAECAGRCSTGDTGTPEQRLIAVG